MDIRRFLNLRWEFRGKRPGRKHAVILLEQLSGLLENSGRILEEVDTLFEDLEHLLEQTALILEKQQYIKTNKFILELFRIY